MNEAAAGPEGSHRTIQLLLVLLVVAGIAMRLLWLDRLTGIDGDEAWEGMIARHWAAGDFVLWRTPTGNFPGPIQPALAALGQWIAPSQFMTLRFPSVLTSLAAMALSWRIGVRHFDAPTARLSLLLMALLPANIAFARFGWDPSHGAMLALAAIATALERRLVLTALLYALALWDHPTNVFMAPMLVVVFARAEQEAGHKPWSPRALALLAAAAAATAVLLATSDQSGQFADPVGMLGRLVSPADWLAFGVLLARVVEGRPWFIHLAGTDCGAWGTVADFAAIALLAGTLWFAIRSLRGGCWSHRGLPAGWLAMLLAFALVAGAAPLNAPTERYAFVLVAPTALVMAMALRQWLGRHAGGIREAALQVALGVMLIASTLGCYLVPLATRDRTAFVSWRGIDALRTGPVEPKEAVARWLLAQPRGAMPLRVIAEEWYLYWPLAYRLDGKAKVINTAADPGWERRASAGPTFVATYAGSPLDRRLAPMARPVFTATGYDGRAIAHLWAR